MVPRVSVQRRAGAPRLIDWTGERCVPWAPDVQVVYEHFHRYLWAARIVGGRKVLDLGSGEGFGAAILAGSAEHVVGVDIDAQTVEHSRLNYSAANLEFDVGTVTDLSTYEAGSFGAVVAFEVIEHVREQERVLGEVARVLGDDGLLVMSTPDRRLYSEATGQHNPFHERELGFEEFLDLVGTHFPHVSAWGQRAITGSHLNSLDNVAHQGRGVEPYDFYLSRLGDEWRFAGDPAALYLVVVASKAPLPTLPATSTLADCDLTLMRVVEAERNEQVAVVQSKEEQIEAALGERDKVFTEMLREREQQEQRERESTQRLRDAWEQRDVEINSARGRTALARQEATRNAQAEASLRTELATTQERLGAALQMVRRVDESVSWQVFQRVRAPLYRAIGGERSLFARALGALLRLGGRMLLGRGRPTPTPNEPAPELPPESPELIEFPEFARPQASLVIPVHAHADLTKACLESIRDNTVRARYEVIIVDDTADEETKALLKTVRGAQIIHNEHNLGFLRSMNRGARAAHGEWLVLFNNDTEVRDSWLAAMLACAQSADDIGVVTPKFIFPDGTLNEAGGIVWRDGSAMNYGRGDAPDRFQYEYRRETDYGSAAALMVNRKFWEQIGGFDERYVPIYYEDTDICFQAREQGLRVLYEPEAVVVHIEGATSGTDLTSGAKRHQEENRKKFVAKWHARLESEQLHPAPANVRNGANRNRGHHVLVIDHRVPMSDRDSGSLRMHSIMSAFLEMGVRVTFMPDNLHPMLPYTRQLQRMGIEVLYGAIDIPAELATLAPTVKTVILCRPHIASRYLDVVREHLPSARVVYDTVDLHWLREARRGLGASGDSLVNRDADVDLAVIPPKAKALREIELALIRATDVTLVVGGGERFQVQRDVPSANVLVLPNVHTVATYVPPPDSRQGILFVGGFEHPPNVDAAVRLVKDVMPSVWAKLGSIKVTIAGPSAPPEVEALASPLVDVVGWVEDLQPLLRGSRLLLAPLRYGAGLKGKVTQCLAVGLPVVTTSIGSEGLEMHDASDDEDTESVLVADSVSGMAANVARLYTDDELWWQLSRAGQRLIERQCSTTIVASRLRQMLDLEAATYEDGAVQLA
jgi:O-antigen biosynthesis protein